MATAPVSTLRHEIGISTARVSFCMPYVIGECRSRRGSTLVGIVRDWMCARRQVWMTPPWSRVLAPLTVSPS